MDDYDHKTTDPYDDDTDLGKKRIFSDLSRSVDKDTIKDGTEDANHNGKIDGDNGDGIYQSTESWTELNPNAQDTDGDTLSDNDERNWSYDPLSKDSDHDGLLDSEEDEDKDGILDAGETDPTKKDTDNDRLDDLYEINGWYVCIYHEGTLEIIDEKIVYSDPNDWDSDNDGLSDYHEFKNATDPNNPDTDGDGISDKDEIEYYFGSSPTGYDGQAPTISDFECEYALRTETSGPLWNIKITMEYVVKIWISADDIFGLEWVNVHLEGVGDIKVHTGDVTSIDYEKYEYTMGYEKAVESLFNDFVINITACDQNGNIGYCNEEIQSIATIVTSSFNGILTKITKVLLSITDPMSIINMYFTRALTSFKDIIDNVIFPNIKLLYYNFLIIIDDGIITDDIQEIIDITIYNIFNPFQLIIDLTNYVIGFIKIFTYFSQQIIDFTIETFIAFFQCFFSMGLDDLSTNDNNNEYNDLINLLSIEILIEMLSGNEIIELSKGVNLEPFVEAWNWIYVIYKCIQNGISAAISLGSFSCALGGESLTGATLSLGSQVLSIISFVTTIIAFGVWLWGFSFEKDDWEGKLTQKTIAGILYIASAGFMGASIIFSADKILSPVAAILWMVGAVPWIIDAIIFTIRYITHQQAERKREWVEDKEKSYSLVNDYNYDYEFYIDLISYNHNANEENNNKFDIYEGNFGFRAKPDISLDLNFGSYVDNYPLYDDYVFKRNANHDLTYNWPTYVENYHDEMRSPSLFTCVDFIILRLNVYDQDDGFLDEDCVNDCIDISPDPNSKTAFIIYNLKDDRLFIDKNRNYKIDEDIDIEIQKKYGNFIISGNNDLDIYGELTIKINNNEPN
ncbi:MAG: hypothetical protein KAH57_09785 [Thermoplasmata archaeon]|nr:hypothetical protein [Thermoplasmata archaeon]